MARHEPTKARHGRVRLFVDQPLAAGAGVPLAQNQAHYLGQVMRRKAGDELVVFNGRDGEWRALIETLARGRGQIMPQQQTRAQEPGADLMLLFAPLKAGPTAVLVEKACELGVSALQPVLTRLTQNRQFNAKRHISHLVEAAEQCERLDVPVLHDALPLEKVLAAWPADRHLLFCDETTAPPIRDVLQAGQAGRWAVLIGPEGGFDEAERAMLRRHPAVRAASLGPRLLRAETAGIAALSCWQALLGDGGVTPSGH